MYLIVGATGSLGGAITHMLLAQGKTVRILARPASNYSPLAEAGAQVVFGDLKERASLDPACQGVDVLITTANSVLRGGDDTPQNLRILCMNCDEGVQKLKLMKPDRLQLLTQVQSAITQDKRALMEWLLTKFNLTVKDE